MKALLGKKIGMTQMFTEDGAVVPVTVIEAGPCVVTQIKNKEKEGYSAIQIGFGDTKEKNLSRPLLGHLARASVSPKRYLTEVRAEESEGYRVGQELKVDLFSVGDRADVTGTSIGKGFAGVIKRWGFSGGPASHGSHSHRIPGSIGASATPSRVHRGKKMPGHMGNKQVTAQNLEVVKVDLEQNLLMVKGNTPGSNGSLVMVRGSVEAKKGER